MLSADQLLAAAVASGRRQMVTVNQKDLIDKMLARYSSDYVVARELIQNGDDAGATSVKISFKTIQKKSKPAVVTELCISNNGRIFQNCDWNRVSRIAEGNPDVDTVGMFGVGFYSVFSLSNSPIIVSGSKALAFEWQGKQLSTLETQVAKGQKETCVVMKMKELRPLWQLRLDAKDSFTAFLSRALTFTRSVCTIIVEVDGRNFFEVAKKQKSTGRIAPKPKVLRSTAGLLEVARIERSTVSFSTMCAGTAAAVVDYEQFAATATTKLEPEWHRKTQMIMKKRLPARTTIRVLFPKFSNKDASQQKGHVFVGLGTHQSTGSAFHLSAQLIPTVERENIDFQDPYLGVWNADLVQMAGQMVRQVYDKEATNAGAQMRLSAMVQRLAFSESHPAARVSELLREGFFAGSRALLVPTAAGAVASTEAVDTGAFRHLIAHMNIERGVPMPVLKDSHSQFLAALARSERHRPKQMNANMLCEMLAACPLQGAARVGNFLSCVCSSPTVLTALGPQARQQRATMSKILKSISWVSGNSKRSHTLRSVKWFLRQAADVLPLPPSVLPLAVAAKLSESQLLDVLHLKPMTTSTWISFITKNPKLMCDPHLAPAILLHLSTHSGSLSNSDWKKLKKATTRAPCVPTTRGMRTPAEAYLPSCKAQDLARVALDVEPDHHAHDRRDPSPEENEPIVVCLDSGDSDDDGDHELPRRVSARFLLALGVHALPPLSVLLQQNTSQKGEQRRCDSNILQTLVDQAVDADSLKEIAQNAFIHCVRNPPVTDVAEEPTHVMCRPAEATLPNPLWDQQPAVNIVDLRRMGAHGEGLKARQYVRLMVELGVRRVPPIAVMLKCCQGGRPAFRFFMRSLGTYGAEFRPNSVQVPFLSGNTNLYQSDADSGNVSQQQYFLPSNVFSQPNPFGAVLQSWVVEEAASAGVTLRQLGVRSLPKFQQILDTLVSRPPSAEAARGVFEWLADRALDGVTPQLSRVMSESPFIPVSDGRVLAPNEVFVSASVQSRKQLAPKRRKHRRACKRTEEDEDENALDEDVTLPHRNPDLLRGLIAFVDFGAEANAFLCRVCGVNTSPSPKQVACLLINHRDAWMSAHGDSVTEYNELLRQYVAPTVALLDKPTRKKLCAAPILLAQRNNSPDKVTDASTPATSGTAGVQSAVQFARASEIVIADDPNLAALLNPLVPASQHIEVEQLYRALGSKWLSVGCTVVSKPRGKLKRTLRSKEVAERLKQRWPLLIHDNRRNMLAGVTPVKAQAIDSMRCFEVDSIEMMVTFRNRTKAFRDAASAPSVTLEGGDRHFRVYVSAAADGIFWGEISKELAKFLLGEKCSADRLRYLTLDLNCKLSQPLDELRRAGVRVDGLMHQQSQTRRLQILDRPEPRASAIASSDSHVDDGVEHIEDFGPGAREFDHDLKKLLRGQRMRQGRLDHSREQANVSMNECRTRIDLKLSRHSTIAASIPFFIDSTVDRDSVTEKVLEHANELATILSTVAKAMSVQVAKSVHVYLDTRGAQVAYNNGGALFFNLRYYMQVHKRGRKRASMREIAYYWYVTLCHELAHNTESLHNLAHESCMEQLIATYLPRTLDAIDRLVQSDRTRKRGGDGLAASSSGDGGPPPRVKRKKTNRTSPINVSSPPQPTECIDLT